MRFARKQTLIIKVSVLFLNVYIQRHSRVSFINMFGIFSNKTHYLAFI